MRFARSTPGRFAFTALAAVVTCGLVLGIALSAAESQPPAESQWRGGPDDVAQAIKAAPWNPISQTKGAPNIVGAVEAPALEFPPGVTHQEAVQQLFESAGRGVLPETARIVDSLPAGKVIAPADGQRGLRLSLTAPFGYDIASGNILLPSVALPAGHGIDDISAAVREAAVTAPDFPLVDGGKVDVAPLSDCQIVDVNSDAPASCAGG